MGFMFIIIENARLIDREEIIELGSKFFSDMLLKYKFQIIIVYQVQK